MTEMTEMTKLDFSDKNKNSTKPTCIRSVNRRSTITAATGRTTTPCATQKTLSHLVFAVSFGLEFLIDQRVHWIVLVPVLFNTSCFKNNSTLILNFSGVTHVSIDSVARGHSGRTLSVREDLKALLNRSRCRGFGFQSFCVFAVVCQSPSSCAASWCC